MTCPAASWRRTVGRKPVYTAPEGARMLGPVLTLLCALPLPLVDQLDSRSYRQRDTASRALRSFGRLALPVLEKTAQTHLRPEVRARCQVLLRPYAEEIAEREASKFRPTRWPYLPWICEYHDWAGTGMGINVCRYLEDARALLDKAGVKRGVPPDWTEYRVATRLWVRSQLLQRRPLQDILREVDWMVTEERGWIAQHGKNYNPPLTVPQGY